jgi:two-component system response regulator
MRTQKTQFEPDFQPQLILVDDDEDDVYFILKALYAVFPEYRIHRLKNGQQLLEHVAAEGNGVQLILLDLNMPVLDGRETLRRLRTDLHNDTPVHVLSRSNHLHEKEVCHEYGANSYIVKPFGYDTYVDVFKHLREDQHLLEPVPVYVPNKKKAN